MRKRRRYFGPKTFVGKLPPQKPHRRRHSKIQGAEANDTCSAAFRSLGAAARRASDALKELEEALDQRRRK
jgi:hypothetical protein